MKRPQFEFRPNRRLKLHQQAWEYLERVPAGQKNEYLVQAILCLESQKGLEKTLRKVLTDPSVAVKGCIRRWPAAVGAVLNGSGAAAAAAS